MVFPEFYQVEYLKDNESGEDARMKIYNKGTTSYAEFVFMNTTYQLKLKPEVLKYNEYFDGKYSLKLSAERNYKQVKPTFYDGEKLHTFSYLTHTNVVYVATDKKASPSFLDVIYYTDTDSSYVKILHTDVEHCYTLPQVEASAKTAVYSNGKVQWGMNNDRSGVLVINNKRLKFVESKSF